VAETFLVARNPEPDSTLPYLIRLPLGGGELVSKARETWPRTAAVYCHRAGGWPEDAEIVEEVPIRSCVRRGVAIDLVLGSGESLPARVYPHPRRTRGHLLADRSHHRQGPPRDSPSHPPGPWPPRA
jgi:hypothetical protein